MYMLLAGRVGPKPTPQRRLHDSEGSPLTKMSAGPANTLNHTSSLNCETAATMITDLRRTESLETLPDISATTLSQDKRELSAWYRARDTPNGRETQQYFPPSDPSSSDERDLSPTLSNPQVFVRHTSLSPASTLTSLGSDAETESSDLTSLDSDLDDDSPISPTSVHLATSDTISRTTSASPSKLARKRKRPGCQPVRHSKRLMVKRRKVVSS